MDFLEKYDEFDVTMKYSYVDEDGKKQEGVADYLERTAMGNYIRSAHYADAALGEFLELLKSNELCWYVISNITVIIDINT